MERSINIAHVFFWLVFIIFIALILWWALGESPTFELLSLGATAMGAVLMWLGLWRSDQVDQAHYDQTQMLEAILKKVR